MDWLLLALLTPILWSIVVLIDDNLLRDIYKSHTTAAIISGLFGLLPLVSLLWMDFDPVSNWLGFLAILSGVLTVGYYYFYFGALEKESPSVVVALFSLSPASLPFLAHFILGERLQFIQIVGFCVVLAFTLALVAIDVRKLKFSSALLPVAIAVVLLNFALLSGKYVYDNAEFYSGFMLFSLGMGIAGASILIKRWLFNRNTGAINLPKSKQAVLILLAFLALTEIINVAAEFVSNLAISKGPVSLVEVLQNTQPMYMLLIALALYPFYPKYFREAAEGRIRFKLLMMTGILVGVGITVVGSI